MKDKVRYFAHLKIKENCPECGNTIFINGPAEKMFCQNCMADIETDKERMISYFKSCYEDVKHEPMYEIDSTDMSNYTINYGNDNPQCTVCKEEIPKEKFLDLHDSQQWDIQCENCKNLIPVSKVPEWIKKEVPSAEIVINAQTNFFSSPSKEETEIEGHVFKCPNCGGSLNADGSKRIVDCQYCQSSVYIPDTLWLRMNPVNKRRVWYIGFSKIRAFTVFDKIDKLRRQEESYSNQAKNLVEKLSERKEMLAGLGTFKRKEKKKLQEQIDKTEKEIKSLENRSEKAKEKLKEIEEEYDNY